MKITNTYPGEIVRVTVGSEVHGVVSDSDDHDELGVYIPAPTGVLGLVEEEHHIARTAWERTGTGKSSPNQPRSQAGDTDLTLYALRKYAKLAVNGNPSIILLFFVPRKFTIYENSWGRLLRSHGDLFLSKDAGRKFLGYLQAQKERMLGTRGQKSVKRPELIEKYGFDTKFAYHAIRLGHQGIELMKSGHISLPMPEELRTFLSHVRRGTYTEAQIIAHVDEVERELLDAYKNCKLPATPYADRINWLITNMHREYWEENYGRATNNHH
jgi:hypothetical protein